MERPNVPPALQPSSQQKLIFVARAKGFQIYVCRADASGEYAWTLKAPEAELFDDQGNLVGTHFGGPTWKHDDGSEIVGKMAAKADSPDPAAIPWLLLNVTGHSGKGILSGVTAIQRINTVGGLPPGNRCVESSGEAEFKSRYTADYFFYA